MSARKKQEPEIKDHYSYELILHPEDIEEMVARMLAERGMIIFDSDIEVDAEGYVIMRCFGRLSKNVIAPELPAVEQQEQEA
jgi:hypothetical protein